MNKATQSDQTVFQSERNPDFHTKQRLALFLDGTWNEPGDNTNVWRLRSLCAVNSSDGAIQKTYYDAGPNGFKGGTFGAGVNENVIQAYEWLIENYNPDDEIFIFGFSRGAFTARSIAGFLSKYGLLRPGAPLSVTQMFERYQHADEKTIWKLNAEVNQGDDQNHSDVERLMVKYARCVKIKMIGVWDTVGALGIPAFNFQNISRSSLKWHHTGLRQPIEHGFHAMAIDEHRPPFKPTLWTVRQGIKAKPRKLASVEQRWFVGAHANVGGGYVNDLLGQPPLRWIANKASEFGLSFRYDVAIDGDLFREKIVDSFVEFLGGCYSIFFGRNHRILGAEPRIDPDESVHLTVNETIDRTVFERWHKDVNYRPHGLEEWAKRKDLDLATINGSVLASDGSAIPNTSAPLTTTGVGG